MSKTIGIDLGTTNSCVAVMEAGEAKVIPNKEGARTTPSMVGFTQKGEKLVGQIAKRQAVTNPLNTVYAVKRLVGKKFDDPEIQKLLKVLPYEVFKAKNGDAWLRIRDNEIAPPEIAAIILNKMREVAQDYLGENVESAIITVPAHFDDNQRQATRDAARIAGLNVDRILNEPTAAALAYGVDKLDQDSKIAIYDLGGGTFDITILQMAEGVFEVKATNGDTFLGGEDFDQRLIDWMADHFNSEHGVDLRQDRMALQRLKEAAEKAKCELSTATEAPINLPFISADENGPKHLSVTLGRAKFEQLVDDIVRRTEKPCMEALMFSGFEPSDIDEVILVGGQTRTPSVRRFVKELFGSEPNTSKNPDEVVAVGTAIQGGVLQGEVKDIVLLDVTPLSLGVETQGGRFVKQIERNANIPTKNTMIFTTVVDNQSTVQIHVLQGERELAAANRSLGRFDLVGIPPAPRGVPQVEVTFEIDSNGIVKVSAKDLATGQAQGIKITPSGGLSESEIQQIISEAHAHEVDDRARMDQLGKRTKLEGMLFTTEKTFFEFGKMMGAKEQASVRSAIESAKRAVQGEEPQKIAESLTELNVASKILTDAILSGSS